MSMDIDLIAQWSEVKAVFWNDEQMLQSGTKGFCCYVLSPSSSVGINFDKTHTLLVFFFHWNMADNPGWEDFFLKQMKCVIR